jgi:hypothetical protein
MGVPYLFDDDDEEFEGFEDDSDNEGFDDDDDDEGFDDDDNDEGFKSKKSKAAKAFDKSVKKTGKSIKSKKFNS